MQLHKNNLGNCYQNGIGTEINESNAFKWYSKSANRECALGQRNLVVGISSVQNRRII